MNSYKKFLLMFFLATPAVKADIFEWFGLKQGDASLEVVLGAEKKTEFEILKKDLEALEAKENAFWQEYAAKIDTIKAQINVVESNLQQYPSNQEKKFLEKKLFVLRTIKQIGSNLKSTFKEVIANQKKHVVILENYLKDPEFVSLQLEKKSFHSFSDLQALNEQIAGEEEKHQVFISEKNEILLDLINRKKKNGAAEALYRTKLQEQADFAQGKITQEMIPDLLDIRYYGQLLDVQLAQFFYEKELTLLTIKEKEVALARVTSQLDIIEKKIEALKNKRDLMARISLRIDEKDVFFAKAQLAEKKKEHLNKTEAYTQNIDLLLEREAAEKELLRNLTKEYNTSIEDSSQLAEWVAEPTSWQSYLALTHVGSKREETAILERAIDLLRAQNELEKAEFSQVELAAQIVDSWYKVKHQRFRTNDDFAKEIKNYSVTNTELEREKIVYEDKRQTATNKLNVQNKELSNIQELLKKLPATRSTLFKGQFEQYQQVNQFLQQAQLFIERQVKITGELISVYSKLLVSLSKSRRQIASVTAELQRVNLWQRSGRAISLTGLTNIVPDLLIFAGDFKTQAISFFDEINRAFFIKKIINLVHNPLLLLILILKVLAALIFFVLMRRCLPLLSVFFSQTSKEMQSAYVMSLMLSMGCQFLQKHFLGIFLWAVGFFYYGMNPVAEMPSIIWYALSIPYLLYLTHQLVAYYVRFNKEHQYVFFQETFQDRFVVFLHWFLDATIIIFLFREVFILTTYSKSELPDILLAFYSIIVRILLLTLIRKEDLLSIISLKNPWSAAVWRSIDRYYYLMLAGFVIIMIMMDPHIGGYNNLVYYIVWGIIGTLLTIKLFYELYLFCRRSASLFFFSSDGETLKERYQYSKVLYGFSLLFFFLAFTAVTFLLIAWIWGRPLSLERIIHFFMNDRLTIAGSSGQIQKLSIFDLIKTFAYIPFSLFVGFVIERFMVNKLFSVLLVNPGVHNAVSTITYYIVVISVITIGLWIEGFGFVIAFYIAPILLGIAWSMRDVFNDFVAYFVILIQRPLKVGDYIEIDETTRGVVRNITPRAVVLRRKRGFCVIIPNSRITRETITNWDYHLNYIACPDITLVIPYRFDPKKVKEMLYQAAQMTGNVLKNPSPLVRLDEFAEHGFEFMVRVYTASENTLLQWEISSDVRLSLVQALREQGVEIAAPVRIIRTVNDTVPPIGSV
ncbi:MAG: hypothetical protein EBU90_13890 [Proteobacteria bacterium]|nr:hypothetical protein [Pseudomonadota bacterium]